MTNHHNVGMKGREYALANDHGNGQPTISRRQYPIFKLKKVPTALLSPAKPGLLKQIEAKQGGFVVPCIHPTNLTWIPKMPACKRNPVSPFKYSKLMLFWISVNRHGCTVHISNVYLMIICCIILCIFIFAKRNAKCVYIICIHVILSYYKMDTTGSFNTYGLPSTMLASPRLVLRVLEDEAPRIS